ncbi:hypothetical protein GBA63_21730 (plasmid) [Rubrobacter tropicus]|uniref:Uncharacterized protein n=1 Tax=Rubrobacter tropicus TaxID=2653851 RepID=A0A6G8QFV5_9ACTN|nr:hypothetical protein [Rubrobacter tropicus]QIN85342.1 hypothetical protein GBA63_21730 [Rubrobacter tropicus]
MTRHDSALLANTPETDRDPYEVYDVYQQGFITHAEYILFQIRRQDTTGHREQICSIVGIDLGGQTDEDLALAYHGFMVLHFGKPSVR